MRIGFDATGLTTGKTAGAHYLAQLVKGLSRLKPALEIFLFSADKICIDYEIFINAPQVKRITLDLSRQERRQWPGRYIPNLLKEYKIEIFHHPCQDGCSVFLVPCPMVQTVMGFGPWFLSGAFPFWPQKWGFCWNQLLWSRMAAKTIVLSQTTGQDAKRFLHLNDKSVSVTPPGPESNDVFALTQDEGDKIVNRYGLLNKKYVINSSGLSDRRHNLNFLLEGFAQYVRWAGNDVKMLVTGSINYEGSYERAMRKLEILGLKDRVVLTGFISDTVYYALLRKAHAAIISSIYSGFSFAMLDSFSAGVPVIASDRGCFSELAGEAAIMVDPYDVAAMTEALRRLLENPLEHALYVEKGFTRAKDFSWERMAEQTFNIYLSILGR